MRMMVIPMEFISLGPGPPCPDVVDWRGCSSLERVTLVILCPVPLPLASPGPTQVKCGIFCTYQYVRDCSQREKSSLD